MEYKEIQRLIKLAKKSGLIRVKVGDIELDFTQEAVRPKIVKRKDDDSVKSEHQDEMKALFWSVPDIDPLAKAE